MSTNQKQAKQSDFDSNDSPCVICGYATAPFSEKLRNTGSKNGSIFLFSLLRCKNCGHFQKSRSEYTEFEKNYYETSYAPSGLSKVSFVNGEAVSREKSLALNCIKFLKVDSDIRILDIGTGDGKLIRAFSEISSQFKLAGFDLSSEKESVIRQNGATDFFHGNLQSIDECFDLITLNHVVEHLTDPVSVLRQASSLLTPDGVLVVVVPSYESVWSDFFFAEHFSHFTEKSLNLLAAFSELSIISRLDGLLGEVEIAFVGKNLTKRNFSEADQIIDWVNSLPQFILENKENREIGIFGVQGTGMWISSILKDVVSFCVDEDPFKQGKTLNAIPVIGVSEIPPNSVVFVTFNNPVSSKIMCERLLKLREDVSFLSIPHMYP